MRARGGTRPPAARLGRLGRETRVLAAMAPPLARPGNNDAFRIRVQREGAPQ